VKHTGRAHDQTAITVIHSTTQNPSCNTIFTAGNSKTKPGKTRGTIHTHIPHHHHRDMWACGITKIESCRSWLPYMRTNPPAAVWRHPSDVDTGWNGDRRHHARERGRVTTSTGIFFPRRLIRFDLNCKFVSWALPRKPMQGEHARSSLGSVPSLKAFGNRSSPRDTPKET
jgi:hypothetical protein